MKSFFTTFLQPESEESYTAASQAIQSCRGCRGLDNTDPQKIFLYNKWYLIYSYKVHRIKRVILSTFGMIMPGVRFEKEAWIQYIHIHTKGAQVSLQLMQGHVGCRHYEIKVKTDCSWALSKKCVCVCSSS